MIEYWSANRSYCDEVVKEKDTYSDGLSIPSSSHWNLT